MYTQRAFQCSGIPSAGLDQTTSERDDPDDSLTDAPHGWVGIDHFKAARRRGRPDGAGRARPGDHGESLGGGGVWEPRGGHVGEPCGGQAFRIVRNPLRGAIGNHWRVPGVALRCWGLKSVAKNGSARGKKQAVSLFLRAILNEASATGGSGPVHIFLSLSHSSPPMGVSQVVERMQPNPADEGMSCHIAAPRTEGNVLTTSAGVSENGSQHIAPAQLLCVSGDNT